jgi:hypothetical protein
VCAQRVEERRENNDQDDIEDHGIAPGRLGAVREKGLIDWASSGVKTVAARAMVRSCRSPIVRVVDG